MRAHKHGRTRTNAPRPCPTLPGYGSGCDSEEWKDGQQLFNSQIP
jgi:hypothetical protein